MRYLHAKDYMRGRKQIILASEEIRAIFLPIIKKHAGQSGYRVRFGQFILSYTNILYPDDKEKLVMGKGLLFRILDKDGHSQTWSFPHAEMLPLIADYLRKTDRWTGEEKNFDTDITSTTDGLIIWL